MSTVTVLPKQGQTFFGGEVPSATAFGQTVALEGTVKEWPDNITVAGQGADGRRSGRSRRSLLVRNTAAFKLLPKRVVKWQSGFRGRRVDGYCAINDEAVAGVVDDAVASDGVAIGDLFWLYRKGPTLFRTALDTTHSAVAMDDILVALTAATSGATTAGRVYPWTGLTSTVTQTTDGTQSRRTINKIGRAMSATTSGNTNSDILVDLMLDD
jgi:hypothetical protein